MSMSAKILTMVLLRSNRYIKRIIHHDQLEFIPGLQCLNICKSNNMIYHFNKTKDKEHTTLSIDAEKAFD